MSSWNKTILMQWEYCLSLHATFCQLQQDHFVLQQDHFVYSIRTILSTPTGPFCLLQQDHFVYSNRNILSTPTEPFCLLQQDHFVYANRTILSTPTGTFCLLQQDHFVYPNRTIFFFTDISSNCPGTNNTITVCKCLQCYVLVCNEHSKTNPLMCNNCKQQS